MLIQYATGLTNKSYTIPNSVTTIGNTAFENCNGLTSVTIPNSVTTIEWSAFFNCPSLTSVTIPNSVTTIGMYAFWFCTGLTNITFQGNAPALGIYVFYNVSAGATVYYYYGTSVGEQPTAACPRSCWAHPHQNGRWWRQRGRASRYVRLTLPRASPIKPLSWRSARIW